MIIFLVHRIIRIIVKIEEEVAVEVEEMTNFMALIISVRTNSKLKVGEEAIMKE